MNSNDAGKAMADHAAHMKELPCPDAEDGKHVWKKTETWSECECCGEHIYT